MIDIDFTLPFEEQIAYFLQKGLTISPNSWRDIWRQAHARAFTVARVTAMEVLEDIRKEIDRAMASGMSFADFRKRIIPMLEKKGWWAPPGEKATVVLPDGTVMKRLTGWRLTTIYGTNMASAYSVGRFKQMMENVERRPYWQYMSMQDAAVRPAHARLHGRIYRYDHPFWDTWYPPNGFNCRCYVKALTPGQVKALGLQVHEDIPTDIYPDEGWDYHVGKAGLEAWRPDLLKYGIIGGGELATALDIKGKLAKASLADEDELAKIIEHILPDVPGKTWGIMFSDRAEFMMWTDQRGVITISRQIWPAFGDFCPQRDLAGALRNIGLSVPLTQNQEYALESLWHEVNHNKQMTAIIPKGTPEHAFMKIINQWISRRTYWQIGDTIPGWAPIHEEWVKSNGYGYRLMVGRFDRMLSILGITDDQILIDLVGIHGGISQDAWIEPVVALLSKISGKPAAKIKQAVQSLNDEALFEKSISDLVQ